MKKKVMIIISVLVAMMVFFAAVATVIGVIVFNQLSREEEFVQRSVVIFELGSVDMDDLKKIKSDINEESDNDVIEIAKLSEDSVLIEMPELTRTEEDKLCAFICNTYGISSDDVTFYVMTGEDRHIENGSFIVLEPNVEDSSLVTNEEIDTVIGIIGERLDAIDLTEAVVKKLDDKAVLLEIPDMDNPLDAIAYVGQVADLQFLNTYGEVVMEYEGNIEGAEAEFEEITGWYVSINLTDEGREIFKNATAEVVELTSVGENYIAIAFDGVVCSMPVVTEVIDSDTVKISGNFAEEDARELASLINSGKLPFSMKNTELYSIGYME